MKIVFVPKNYIVVYLKLSKIRTIIKILKW